MYVLSVCMYVCMYVLCVYVCVCVPSHKNQQPDVECLPLLFSILFLKTFCVLCMHTRVHTHVEPEINVRCLSQSLSPPWFLRQSLTESRTH